VDAVALTVGYKSRKNFYEALRVATGLTPSGVRRLSEDEARLITDRLRLTLVKQARKAG